MISIKIISCFILIFIVVKCMEYQNYETLSKNLKHFAELYPGKCQLYSIGKTVENRDIWVMAIANSHPDHHVILRPEVKYIGLMHGNKYPSQELLYHLLHILLENPNNDESINYILNNMRVHILPSLNPDGGEKSVIDCTQKLGRNNSNGFDLNRNFDDMYFCNSDPLQPETHAIIEWLEENDFILSASLHTGSFVASYGFDNFPHSEGAKAAQKNPTEDEDVLKYLAYTYAKNNPFMLNATCDGESFENGITNGAAWFPPVRGGMQDFNYWKYGCIETTIEVNCCLKPAATQLSEIWKQNKKSLIEYLKMGNTGVKGIINFENGNPAKYLSVKINSIDPAFKTNKNGEYYRLLLPGLYNMTLMLNCEEFFHIPFEIPSDSGLLELNITLKNEIYDHLQHYNLDKYPIFCKEQKKPVSCPIRHLNISPEHENSSCMIKFNISMLALISIATLLLNLI